MATSFSGLRALVISLLVLASASTLYAQSVCTTSLYDAVTATPELQQLKSVIDAAGLKDIFSDKSLKITVLAPNNKAFEDLQAVLSSLNLTLADTISPDNKAASVLLYHGIPVPAFAKDLQDKEVLPTLLGDGYNLTVDLSSGVKFITPENDASVVTADIKVCDSVVHIIDTVLLPAALSDIPSYTPPTAVAPAPAAARCGTSLYDAVSATPELQELKTVIDAAGLKNTFSDKSLEITVLAPNNKAFKDLEALLAGMNLTLADTISPNNKAASILLYHGIPVPAFAKDLTDKEVLPTLLGDKFNLTVDLSQGVKFVSPVNSASVVTPDIVVCYSVVHIIDAVLIPAPLSDIPNYVPPTPSGPAPAAPPPGPPMENAGNNLGSSVAVGIVATAVAFTFAMA